MAEYAVVIPSDARDLHLVGWRSVIGRYSMEPPTPPKPPREVQIPRFARDDNQEKT
jgi:hypothetical protein